MARPESLPATLYLLAYDPLRQRLVDRQNLGYLLRSAVLTELALRGYVVDAEGTVRPAGAEHPVDPVLDDTFRKITEDRPRSWKGWVRRDPRTTLAAVAGQLEASGLIVDRPKKVLGIFPAHTITVTDPGLIAELRERAAEVLRGTRPVEQVDPMEAAVVALAAAAALRTVVSRRDQVTHKQRIKALTERSGEAVPALKKVLAEINVAAGVAAGAAAGGAVSGS